jgi:hypothetical protein
MTECVPSVGWRIREIPDCASSPKRHAGISFPTIRRGDSIQSAISQRKLSGSYGP